MWLKVMSPDLMSAHRATDILPIALKPARSGSKHQPMALNNSSIAWTTMAIAFLDQPQAVGDEEENLRHRAAVAGAVLKRLGQAPHALDGDVDVFDERGEGGDGVALDRLTEVGHAVLHLGQLLGQAFGQDDAGGFRLRVQLLQPRRALIEVRDQFNEAAPERLHGGGLGRRVGEFRNRRRRSSRVASPG